LSLLFAAIALLYAGPALLPGRALLPVDAPRDMLAWKRDPSVRIRVSNSLLSDSVVQFDVWNREIRRLIANGEMPWMNRYAADGAPLFANPQTAVLSPFAWLPLLFGTYGWSLAALMKLIVAAGCAYWLARELEIEHRAAVLSAIVFACSGEMIVWLLYSLTNVLALLPGFLAAALRLIRQPQEKNAFLVIVFAALLTAGGHPETLMVGVIAAFVFLIWHCERTHKWGALGTMPAITGSFLGFLVLAVVTVPFAIIAQASYTTIERSSLVHPFRLWTVISQVLPGILGSPLRNELDLTALPRAEAFSIRVGSYIGAVVLLAIIVSWRDLSPVIRRGLKIGLAALLISWCPPGIDRVFRNVPLFRLLAFQYCAAAFLMFGAMAAGPALLAVSSRPRKRLGILLLIAGVATLIAGIVPLLPAARPALVSLIHGVIEQLRARGHMQQSAAVYEQRLSYYLAAAGTTSLRRVALPGLLWIAAGIALFLGRQRTFALAALAELIAFGIGFNPSVSLNEAPPMPPAIAEIKRLDPENRWLIAANAEVFPANLGTNYAVRDVVSYDVLMPMDHVEQLLHAGYDPRVHTIPPQLSPENLHALARLGVRFVINGDGSVTQIPNPALHPMPANRAPAGIVAGALVSLLAIGLSIGWLRLYRSTFDSVSF